MATMKKPTGEYTEEDEDEDEQVDELMDDEDDEDGDEQVRSSMKKGVMRTSGVKREDSREEEGEDEAKRPNKDKGAVKTSRPPKILEIPERPSKRSKPEKGEDDDNIEDDDDEEDEDDDDEDDEDDYRDEQFESWKSKIDTKQPPPEADKTPSQSTIDKLVVHMDENDDEDDGDESSKDMYVPLPGYGEHKRAVSSVKFAPSRMMKKDQPTAALCASSSADGYIKLWNVQNRLRGGKGQRQSSERNLLEPTVTCGGHTRGINDIAWNPISPFLASASDDKTVCFVGPCARNGM